MRIIFRLVCFAAFIACATWAVMKPGFDSITITIMSLASLLGSFILNKKTEATQSQKVGRNATANQAGRDIKFRD